mgnify:CR=1 FL=1
MNCLLYTSDAADERSSVDLGGRRIIKKKKNENKKKQRSDDDNTHKTNIKAIRVTQSITQARRME